MVAAPTTIQIANSPSPSRCSSPPNSSSGETAGALHDPIRALSYADLG
jgi:hypothetical protein